MDTLIAIIHYLPWKRVWAIQEAFAYRFREKEIHFYDDEFWILDTNAKEHDEMLDWFKENIPEYMIGKRVCLDL